MSDGPTHKVSTSVLLVCATIVTVALISAVVVVTLAGGTDATVTQLLGFATVVLPSLGALAVSARTDRKADQLLNGTMDAKIQRNVRQVLDERDDVPTVPADELL